MCKLTKLLNLVSIYVLKKRTLVLVGFPEEMGAFLIFDLLDLVQLCPEQSSN